MIRTIFFWLAFLATILTGVLAGPLFSIINRKEEVVNRIAVIGSRVLLWIGGVKVSISGLENIPRDENVIFVSNHQGGVDAYILLVFLRKRFRPAIMQQIFNAPLLNNFFKKAGYILVDQTSPKRALIATRKIVSLLQKGESILLFPEGTRSPDGRLLEFKEGAAMLVLEAKKTVVPIAISGSYKVMQRDELYGMRVRPGRVKVVVGKPITFAEFQEVNLENARKINAKLKETITGLMQEGLKAGL